MTVIHHAGLNTGPIARRLVGHPVLMSFADVMRRPAVFDREILPRIQAGAYPSVILDSGAFTEKKDPSFHVDLEAYADFAVKYSALFTFVVNLDDIDGDIERSDRNQEYLESRGVKALPVYHQGEPWSRLDALTSRYDHIGVGFARDDKGCTHGCEPFLNEFFKRLPAGVEVHGFGMNSWALKGYPFTTTDAMTWTFEAASIKHQPDTPLGEMVRRLDIDQRTAIVVDSYRAAPPVQDASDAGWIEGAAKGQARVVFRRYGAKALLAKLREVTGVHVIIERRAA